MTLYFRKPVERAVGHIRQIVDFFNEKSIKKSYLELWDLNDENQPRMGKTTAQREVQNRLCSGSVGVS